MRDEFHMYNTIMFVWEYVDHVVHNACINDVAVNAPKMCLHTLIAVLAHPTELALTAVGTVQVDTAVRVQAGGVHLAFVDICSGGQTLVE